MTPDKTNTPTPACRYCLGTMEPDTDWNGGVQKYFFVCEGCRSRTPHGTSRESALYLANHPAPSPQGADTPRAAFARGVRHGLNTGAPSDEYGVLKAIREGWESDCKLQVRIAPTPSETLTAPAPDPKGAWHLSELEAIRSEMCPDHCASRLENSGKHGPYCRTISAAIEFFRPATEAPGTASFLDLHGEADKAREINRVMSEQVEKLAEIPGTATPPAPAPGTDRPDLLEFAALRGWKRGRRNQDCEPEEIVKNLLAEYPPAAPKGTEPPARPLESVQSRRAKLAMSIVNYTCENTGVSVKVRQQQNDRLFAWAENQLEEYAAFRADLAAKPSNPLTPKGGEA